MKNTTITIQVEHGDHNRRVFRFDKPEIVIGFSPTCHVSLEPHSQTGGELALVTKAGRRPVLKGNRNPGAFNLNGAPCGEETAVKAGDILTSNGYRITIYDLLGATDAVEIASASTSPSASSSSSASLV